jgi:hypothetical protein
MFLSYQSLNKEMAYFLSYQSLKKEMAYLLNKTYQHLLQKYMNEREIIYLKTQMALSAEKQKSTSIISLLPKDMINEILKSLKSVL